jgi:hypothetical protein
MFSNQRRGTVGLGGLAAVALVLLGFLASAGLLAKTYREGGLDPHPACEVVCREARPAVVQG